MMDSTITKVAELCIGLALVGLIAFSGYVVYKTTFTEPGSAVPV